MLKINNKQIRAPPAGAVLCVGGGGEEEEGDTSGCRERRTLCTQEGHAEAIDVDLVSQKCSEEVLGQQGGDRSWPLKDPIGAAFLAPPPSHL